MVLSPPAPDDPPGSSPWVTQLKAYLHLGRGGVLILLRSEVPAGWRVILESLLAQDPNATVCLDAASVLSQPAGRHLLFAPRPEDVRTLNPLREILGERKLVMVWQASSALIDQMRGQAPDLHDWFSHEIAQPPDVPASAREALRRPGFVFWADGDLELAMRQVAPSWPVHRLTVKHRFDRTMKRVPEGWRVWQVSEPDPARHISFPGIRPRAWPPGQDVVIGLPPAPFYRLTHGTFEPPLQATARLPWFGARAPAVAAWLDLDPERIDGMIRWFRRLSLADVERAMGATLSDLEGAVGGGSLSDFLAPEAPRSSLG